MELGLGERSAKGDRSLADKGVHAEKVGNDCGVRDRQADLKDVYKGGDDGGIQKAPQVVVPRTRPHSGRQGDGGKETQCSV